MSALLNSVEQPSLRKKSGLRCFVLLHSRRPRLATRRNIFKTLIVGKSLLLLRTRREPPNAWAQINVDRKSGSGTKAPMMPGVDALLISARIRVAI